MRKLSEKEIIELIERELPRIIKEHPEVRMRIEEILEKKAATKDDIKAILEELRKLREDTNRRFEEVNRRFEKVDRRFEKFYEELKKLREDTNRRFAEVDRRFEKVFEEMRKLREDTNRRFEEVNRRFEKVDRRFEEVNRRFEEVNRRFEEVNRRFEEVDRRFEEQREEMKRGFEKLSHQISALGSRWGIGAENAFRKALKEILEELGYKVEKWRKTDEKCEFFFYQKTAEIDIVIKDRKKIAIEIKSSLSEADLENFEKCVRFYEKAEKEKLTEKMIITAYPRPGVMELASKFGIKIIKGLEEIKEFLD